MAKDRRFRKSWLAACAALAMLGQAACGDDSEQEDAAVDSDAGDAQTLADAGDAGVDQDGGDGGPDPTLAVLHVDGDAEDATMFLTWSSYYCDDDCLWDVYAEYPASTPTVTVPLPDDPDDHMDGSWWTNPEPSDPTVIRPTYR